MLAHLIKRQQSRAIHLRQVDMADKQGEEVVEAVGEEIEKVVVVV